MPERRPLPAQGPGWTSLVVPGTADGVPVRVYRPGEPSCGRLVWAHGGSWTAGSLPEWHSACALLAEAAACTVVSVDYRLAPRHPHPAALEDVTSVVEWAWRQALADGDPGGVCVGGDSAGATIAACVALESRGTVPLTGQVLAYPPLDPECAAPSYDRFPGAFPSRAWMRASWRAYRGPGGGSRAGVPGITPLDAADLRGAPPAALAAGEFDPVADDVRLYARRLAEAGCPVAYEEFPGMRHGTFLAGGRTADGTALHGWLGARVRELTRAAANAAAGTA